MVELQALKLPGASFRKMYFIPTFDRYANNVTCGAQLYVTDPKLFKALEIGLEVIALARRLHPASFAFYDEDFDLHMGTNSTRLDLEAGTPVLQIISSWQSDLATFTETGRPYLLYHEK